MTRRFPDFTREIELLNFDKKFLKQSNLISLYKEHSQKRSRVQVTAIKLLWLIINKLLQKSNKVIKALVYRMDDPALLERLIEMVEEVYDYHIMANTWGSFDTLCVIIRYLRRKIKKRDAMRRTAQLFLKKIKYCEGAKTIQDYLSN
jgi:hypothetical protein